MMISIIIPTYKTRGGLVRSVDSVLNQSYQEIEIIVVDDNDPLSDFRNQTEILMAKYMNNPKVRYLKHEINKNGAAARNTGIRASKGEYVAFLDDDDEYLQTKLEKQLIFLENHKEFQAVYCRIIEDDKVINAYPYEGNCLVPLLMERTRMFTSTLMFRRDALLSFGGFNENFFRHQDYDLMVNFFVHGYSIGLVKEPLIVYSTSGNNRLQGSKLEDLKTQYLHQFESVIDELDRSNPGIKDVIIANNYASVFVSHLASRHYFDALRVFKLHFFRCPRGFISYIMNFIRNHIVTFE